MFREAKQLTSKTFLLRLLICEWSSVHALYVSHVSLVLSLQEKGSAEAFSYNESQPPVLLHPCLQGSNCPLLCQGKSTSSCEHTISLLLCESHASRDKKTNGAFVVTEDRYVKMSIHLPRTVDLYYWYDRSHWKASRVMKMAMNCIRHAKEMIQLFLKNINICRQILRQVHEYRLHRTFLRSCYKITARFCVICNYHSLFLSKNLF